MPLLPRVASAFSSASIDRRLDESGHHRSCHGWRRGARLARQRTSPFSAAPTFLLMVLMGKLMFYLRTKSKTKSMIRGTTFTLVEIRTRVTVLIRNFPLIFLMQTN
jgi:hypothetical protein